MDNSWFRNLKLTSSYETTTKSIKVRAINYEPWGVPVEVSGRVDAINLEVLLARS